MPECDTLGDRVKIIFVYFEQWTCFGWLVVCGREDWRDKDLQLIIIKIYKIYMWLVRRKKIQRKSTCVKKNMGKMLRNRKIIVFTVECNWFTWKRDTNDVTCIYDKLHYIAWQTHIANSVSVFCGTVILIHPPPYHASLWAVRLDSNSIHDQPLHINRVLTKLWIFI